MGDEDAISQPHGGCSTYRHPNCGTQRQSSFSGGKRPHPTGSSAGLSPSVVIATRTPSTASRRRFLRVPVAAPSKAGRIAISTTRTMAKVTESARAAAASPATATSRPPKGRRIEK